MKASKVKGRDGGKRVSRHAKRFERRVSTKAVANRKYRGYAKEKIQTVGFKNMKSVEEQGGLCRPHCG
jgi:hypothetical protein